MEAYLLASLICLTAAYLGALMFGSGLVAPLVTLGMLLALVVIAALVYVLPGQFTFWPAAMAGA